MGCFRSIRHKLSRVTSYSLEDWWIIAQSWVLLAIVDTAVRRLPFPVVQTAVRRSHKTGARSPLSAPDMVRLHRLVAVAAGHHLCPMRCLQRTLALQWLLGRSGIQTQLRIGVRKEAGDFGAHAWLECDGEPIGEPEPTTLGFVSLTDNKTDEPAPAAACQTQTAPPG